MEMYINFIVWNYVKRTKPNWVRRVQYQSTRCESFLHCYVNSYNIPTLFWRESHLKKKYSFRKKQTQISSLRAFFVCGSWKLLAAIDKKIDSNSTDRSNRRLRRVAGDICLFSLERWGLFFSGAGGHRVVAGILWSDDVGVLKSSWTPGIVFSDSTKDRLLSKLISKSKGGGGDWRSEKRDYQG